MSRGGEAGLRRGAGRVRRGAALGLLLGLTLGATGCVSLFGGMSTAPSGLSWPNHELRTMLADGRSGRALETLDAEDGGGWVGDELLRLQYRGLVAHYAGRWTESSRALERAFELAEDRYTESVTRALLSLVTSDRVLDYEPPRPERLFLHYYGALNYLHRDEPDEAAVEARRMGHILGQVLEGEGGDVPPELGRALSVFAGTIFEAAGQENDAAVAYRRARVFRRMADGAGPVDPSSSRPEGLSAGGAPGDGDADPWAGIDPWPGSEPGDGSGEGGGATAGPEPSGRVLVVLERGFVAHKVERDLTFFLLPREVHRLRSFRRAALSDRAEADTTEVLELAERVAGRSLGSSHRSYGRRRDADLDDLVLMRIAWPELRESGGDVAPATLQVDGRRWAGEPALRADLSRAVREAFAGSRIMKMAKSLVRAAAKIGVAEGIEDAVSEEDETLGDVLGTAARVAGALLERADTRSWHLLPDRLEIYLLRLPPGTHRLEARVGSGSGAGGAISIGPVEVEAGRVRVVTARQWR